MPKNVGTTSRYFSCQTLGKIYVPSIIDPITEVCSRVDDCSDMRNYVASLSFMSVLVSKHPVTL